MDEQSRLNQEIGKRIRDARKARNMSQQEVAAKANISLSHISDIECGKQAMKVGTLVKILEVLQVSADSILRVNIPEVNILYQNELNELIQDCSPSEIESIKRIVEEFIQAIKKSE